VLAWCLPGPFCGQSQAAASPRKRRFFALCADPLRIRAVVDTNRLRLAALHRHPFQDPHDIVSRKPPTNLDGQALTAKVLDERQQTEPLPADRSIIGAPAAVLVAPGTPDAARTAVGSGQ
jgi:hypothetical protein